MMQKFPYLPWILIPMAAAAGFLGSRQQHRLPSVDAARPSPATTRDAGQSSTTTKAGLVSTWTERLAKCLVGDLPALYAEIQLLPEKADIRRAMLLLFARWVELDARGGLAFFSVIEDKNLRRTGRMGLLTEWALADPLATYAALSQQPEKEAEADIRNVGHALLRADPDKFWIWFRNFGKPLPYPSYQHDFWQRLATRHLDELSAMATELLREEEANPVARAANAASASKLQGLHSILAAARAETDPDKAVEWAGQLPESVRGSAVLGALEVMAKKSPQKMADYLSLLKDQKMGEGPYMDGRAVSLFRTALGEMLKKDTLGTLDWVRGNIDKLGGTLSSVFPQVGRGLAAGMRAGKLTPEQAFAAVVAATEHNGEIRDGVIPNMWKGLPPTQLAATAKWLTTIESKEVATMALEGIFPEWFQQDQAAAIAFAGALKDRELAAKMYDTMAGQKANGLNDTLSERMTAALLAIPPEYRAEIAANQIWLHYETTSLKFTGTFDGPAYASLLEGLPAGPSMEKAVTQLASAWGAREPESALAWAAGQTDGNLRQSATGAVVEAWAKEDAWGTSQWVEALPQGERRDLVSYHLARSLSKVEPASAWTWAGSIGDPAARLEAQADVLREWRNSSAPDAAAAVLELADKLEPAAHQKLMDVLVPPAKAQ